LTCAIADVAKLAHKKAAATVLNNRFIENFLCD
jgi:hypothetical protein